MEFTKGSAPRKPHFKAAEEQRIKYETILKSITDKAKEDLYSTHQKKTDNSFWS
jgi:coproporphyrinogen III oxidase